VTTSRLPDAAGESNRTCPIRIVRRMTEPSPPAGHPPSFPLFMEELMTRRELLRQAANALAGPYHPMFSITASNGRTSHDWRRDLIGGLSKRRPMSMSWSRACASQADTT